MRVESAFASNGLRTKSNVPPRDRRSAGLCEIAARNVRRMP